LMGFFNTGAAQVQATAQRTDPQAETHSRKPLAKAAPKPTAKPVAKAMPKPKATAAKSGSKEWEEF
ncbi:hypothetical protein, partial [Magnetospirillum aberrantis]|uniref:hypothetical protein n=1 Tax=Magnetospirillum aberrantis TaxID=1105283 RepID=UPI00197CB14F